jgi:hypothetical protein
MKIPSSVMLIVVFLLLFFVPAYSIILLFRYKNRNKKSPFSEKILRWPGKTLNENLQDISFDISFYIMIIPITVMLLYGIYLTLACYGDNKKINPELNAIIYSIPFVIFFIFKLVKKITERNKYRLGFEAELYTGMELNNLIKNNCKIYHDFPAEKFNIDHIVISPAGIFAIETKGRSKVKNEATNNRWKLEFDGEILKFPTWIEKAPIDQAKRQAAWLSSWLSKAVGESIKVRPVLAFPGWYITTTKPSEVAIYNGKNPLFMAQGNPQISEKLMTRIAHQIEQKCRDIESTAYIN